MAKNFTHLSAHSYTKLRQERKKKNYITSKVQSTKRQLSKQHNTKSPLDQAKVQVLPQDEEPKPKPKPNPKEAKRVWSRKRTLLFLLFFVWFCSLDLR